MKTGNVAIMLVYEPPTAKGKPLPLVRIEDESMVRDAAKIAIADARTRAEELGRADAFLGEMERAEVTRLSQVLALLIPGLAEFDQFQPVSVQ